MGKSFVNILKNAIKIKADSPSDTKPASMVKSRVDSQRSFIASKLAINTIEYNRQNAPSIIDVKKQNSFFPKVISTEKKKTRNRNITLATRTGSTGNILTLLTHAAKMTKTESSTP